MTASLLFLLAFLIYMGQHDEAIADWLARRDLEIIRERENRK